MDKIRGSDSVRYSTTLYDGTDEQYSQALGKSRNYIANYMYKASVPSVSLFAHMLSLSGYRLAILDSKGKPVATITPD